MTVKDISTDDLRRMKNSEGIIFQGCGGEAQEWIDGINSELNEAGILLNETKFTDVCRFHNDNVTCLLFPFSEGVQFDMGRLAIWRLTTHNRFAGTWLSDYVPNRLGGFTSERKKPDCALIGQDGNIFNLVGIASHTLKHCGLADQAKEMSSRVMSSGSYNEALSIIGEYVNITDGSESEDCVEDIGEGQRMSL